ncbi:MAG: hypothetical protein KC910_36695, partial [Candidatus Eremiobacteraeota bacterium]|nr:hypothetical protein [Candidatus Eremiobacteraeota bacterium]
AACTAGTCASLSATFEAARGGRAEMVGDAVRSHSYGPTSEELAALPPPSGPPWAPPGNSPTVLSYGVS